MKGISAFIFCICLSLWVQGASQLCGSAVFAVKLCASFNCAIKKKKHFSNVEDNDTTNHVVIFFFLAENKKNTLTSTFRVEGSLAGMNEPWKILKMFL